MKSLFIIVFVALAEEIGPVALGADSPAHAFTPGVPLGTNERNFIRIAASSSLRTLQRHITPSNYQLLGFGSTNEVLTATNGEPLLVFVVQLEKLTNFQVGSDINSLLPSLPASRAIVPILVGTNVKSSTTVRRAPGPAGGPVGWVGADWGRAKLIRDLTETYRAIPSGEINPKTVPFAVELPIPRIWLLGYYDRQGRLVLRSTIDLHLGPITISRKEVITPAAMEQLAREARRFNPNLPT